MGSLEFFDVSRRYARLATAIPWETFRPTLLAALTAQDLRTPRVRRL